MIVEGECMNKYQQLDAREAKQFWYKIWEQRHNNREAEGIN